eukprot:Blabericola_migrator_1__12118@NODE_747_length_6663_cov_33_227259_g331_i2_p3_GENE_NODE_747_length_6663_cov_33_227259_g331_i2NODE_747_length_6663_cov_33_227259_g331_i2_p3_ORF_typecomplete_len275_score19_65_NODE_747_length_6663_cov_33_227259_g331_i252246048
MQRLDCSPNVYNPLLHNLHLSIKQRLRRRHLSLIIQNSGSCPITSTRRRKKNMVSRPAYSKGTPSWKWDTCGACLITSLTALRPNSILVANTLDQGEQDASICQQPPPMPPPDRAAEIGAAVSHVWPSMIPPPPPPPPPRSPLLRPSEVTLPSNQSPHSSEVNRVTPKPSTLRRSATDFTTANLIRQAHASVSGSDDTDSIVDVIESAEVVELRRPQEHSMPVITERQSDTEPGAPGVLIHLSHTSRYNSVQLTECPRPHVSSKGKIKLPYLRV